jgi:transposase
MKKQYRVLLTEAEREQLRGVLAAGRHAAQSLMHARVLLKADEGPDGPSWRDDEIVEALEISRPTVERIRRRYAQEGLEAALTRRPSSRRPPRKLDGLGEAQLVAIACTNAPTGRGRWTLRLLADRLVRLEVVDAISHETVRQVLKKTRSSPGSRSNGACPTG